METYIDLYHMEAGKKTIRLALYCMQRMASGVGVADLLISTSLSWTSRPPSPTARQKTKIIIPFPGLRSKELETMLLTRLVGLQCRSDCPLFEHVCFMDIF